MSRGEMWLSAGFIFVVALAVRLWAASTIPFARPEDAAYYVGVAANLVHGRGLVSDAIWSYQTPPLTFPRPAFEVWLPLPSFLYAIPMLALGTSLALGMSLAAAQLASAVVGAIAAALAWRLALDAATAVTTSPGRVRSISIGAGLTAAVFLPLVLASVEPDSTAPFAVLALAACLLMPRLAYAYDRHHRRERDEAAISTARPERAATERPAAERAAAVEGDTPSNGSSTDGHEDEGRGLAHWSWGLVGLGITLGLAALTRNEAIWLALTWAVVAWWRTIGGRPTSGRARIWLRLVAIPAVLAVVVFVPWAIRDWLTFGTPLPGQALANALSLKGTDIFAWSDPPTLARYLSAGVGTLVQLRVTGFEHNLVDVLLLLGTPVTLIGLVALPWTARGGSGKALRPLLLFSAITFVATTLLFPVATTWGTFLHAAGAIEVLLIVSAVLALDRVVEWLRARQGWTRPVAWLAPTLTVVAALLLTSVLLPSEGAAARRTQARYQQLPVALTLAGHPLAAEGPVITDFPIWFAESTGHDALALPDESATSVADLARHFGATLLVVQADDGSHWPHAAPDPTDPASNCFSPLPMTHLGDDPGGLADVRVYVIRCP